MILSPVIADCLQVETILIFSVTYRGGLMAIENTTEMQTGHHGANNQVTNGANDFVREPKNPLAVSL